MDNGVTWVASGLAGGASGSWGIAAGGAIFMPDIFIPELFMPGLIPCCANGRRGAAKRLAPVQKPIRSKSRLLKDKRILRMTFQRVRF